MTKFRQRAKISNLTGTLAELFRTECPDAVQTKAENDAILVAQTCVKTIVLNRHGAAVEGITGGDVGGAHKR